MTSTTDSAPWREALTRQENIRQQVAKALHNEIGQAVSAIKMSAHLAVDEDDAAQRREDLREIVRIADDTVARLRELYALLRPAQMDALGLEASLRGEADAWRMRWSVEPIIRVDFHDARPQAAVELAAFRLVQEALETQPEIHHLTIHARHRDTDLLLSLEHDGATPDATTLALLQARAQAFGGGLDLIDETPGAVRVHARLPWAGAPA